MIIDQDYELWLDTIQNNFFQDIDAELDAMALYFEQSGVS